MVPQISGVEARRDSLLSSVCRSTFDVRRSCERTPSSVFAGFVSLQPLRSGAIYCTVALLHCCTAATGRWTARCAVAACGSSVVRISGRGR